MSKDIFEAAKHSNGKPNPIVAALLHAYCHAAAHWYVRNVPPQDVYDPVWHALEDYATDKTMADCLREYGLGDILPEIKKYVDTVKALRSHYAHLGIPPELTGLYGGNQSNKRYGLQNELNRVGGSWRSLLEYVRVWTFLMKDWKSSMQVPAQDKAKRVFRKFTVSLSAQGVHTSSMAHFPVWGWEVTVGRVKSVFLGLLVPTLDQDDLRFTLVQNSSLIGEQPWPGGNPPMVFALHQDNGTAQLINPKMEASELSAAVLGQYEAARTGPNYPVRYYMNGVGCSTCGYKHKCYSKDGNAFMHPALLQLTKENKRERSYLTGYSREQAPLAEATNEQSQ